MLQSVVLEEQGERREPAQGSDVTSDLPLCTLSPHGRPSSIALPRGSGHSSFQPEALCGDMRAGLSPWYTHMALSAHVWQGEAGEGSASRIGWEQGSQL